MPGRTARDDDLFTAPQVARLCATDLKTVHNWVHRGEIRHFRTPGRHLRFRRNDVVAFLQRFGYPVPPDFRAGPPRVLVLDRDPALARGLRRRLGPAFVVLAFAEAVEALVELGRRGADVLVLDLRLEGVSSKDLVERLGDNDQTRHMPIVVHCRGPRAASVAHLPNVREVVVKPDPGGVARAVREIAGSRPASG